MADKYEYYEESGSHGRIVYGDDWYGQSFTPLVGHKITSVKLTGYRAGAPGLLTVSIKSTDVNGHPTGEDLCSGTCNVNGLPTSAPGSKFEVTLGEGAVLLVSTKYAILARALDGDGSNFFRWWSDGVGATYPRGIELHSTDGGATWETPYDADCYFEDWGEAPPALPTVQTNEADGITHAQATLHGTLADDGGEACDVRFQYGETTAYGTNTEWQSDKVSTNTFEQLIAALDANKTYHFRAQAKNSAGTADGADEDFTTEEAPPPPGVYRKVSITHPALKTVRVIRGGAEQTKYDNLSNLDEGFIHGKLQLPVEPPAIVEVTTLANQTYNFNIN